MDAPPASRHPRLRSFSGWTRLIFPSHCYRNAHMSTDFYNAFYRHATDADLLLDKERWANADHHYGLAAECALKAILLQQGISSKGGDIADPKYKQHIDKLWEKYQSFMQTKNTYVLPTRNSFHDWSIDQRYAHENDITEQTARNHGAAVASLKKIVKKAELAGVLP